MENARLRLSPRVINDWPVLMVVWDREAEAVFQQLGQLSGVPMLTSTVERTKKYKVVGDPGCWSMYGEAVGVS